MILAVVLECSPRREGIAERLSWIEQPTLPRVSSGDHYRSYGHIMGDAVLVGPGHSRAEEHLDARGRVRLLLNEDVCDTKGRRSLRNRPHRASCSKGSTRRCDCYAYAGQRQDAYQDSAYEEPHRSMRHLD